MHPFLVFFMLWQKIKKYFPLIGIVLFGYLLIKLNILEVLKQVAETNKFYLLIAILLVFPFLFFQTLKWHVLARKQKITIGFWKSFKINLISDFYGLVTPGKLGSVIRAEYLKEHSSIGKGLSNFVVDKVLDLISLFSLAIILGFIVLREYLNLMIMNYLVFFFLILVLCFLIFYNKKQSKFFLKFIHKKFVPKKMKGKAKATFNSFYEDLPKKRSLFEVFILNVFSWIVNYSVVYFIALSLGININFLYFIAIYPIATLVAQIPITISGLGTREATLIGLFGLFGISNVKVFSMSVLGLLIMAIIPSLIILPTILKRKKENALH